MNTNNLFYCLLGISGLLLLSCQSKETVTYDAVKISYRPVFEAAIEPVSSSDESKVYADENLMVLWHADDRVGIFDHYTYNQQYAFQGETGANAGTFKIVPTGDVVVGNAIPAIYAVYPYDAGTTISNDCVLNLTLPATQNYAESGFAPGVNVMVSATEDNYLLFKNLGGYLAVKLYGENASVSRISLKGNNGEKLAGRVFVTAPLDGVPSVEMAEDASGEVTVECASPVVLGSTAEDYTEFWFVLPPTEFSHGFTITVYDDKDGYFEQATEKPVTVSRNNLSRMSPVEVEMPEGIASKSYLTFTSEGTTTLALTRKGGMAPVFYYSTDKENWMQWDYSTLSFSRFEPLYLYGENPEGCGSSTYRYCSFVTDGDLFSVDGDVMSLIDSESGESNLKAISTGGCFCRLFAGCSNLVSGPSLPATELSYGCYQEMFKGCTSLKRAPDLPATTLSSRCYESMFEGCTSLLSAPDLPATVLEDSCYRLMFRGCSSLSKASALPAESLAHQCYAEMFEDCSNLTEAPVLPATTLANDCYSSMFKGSGLKTAPALPATTLNSMCYYCMFDSCASLTAAPNLPALNLANRCYARMFWGCTGITEAPSLPATTLADYCYMEMFHGCTGLKKAPALPAPTLTDFCYYSMFRECSNLYHVECLATDISAVNSRTDWLLSVSPSGTFVKSSVMNDWPTGTNGIPEGWKVVDAE